jgi:hypothetical protein
MHINMKIKEVVSYFDGGTVDIVTDRGVYSVDNRLFTKTPGKLFFGYPRDDNKNIMKEDEVDMIKDELLLCLENFSEEKMDAKKDYLIQLIKESNI